MIYSIEYTNDIPEGFNGWAHLWHIKIRPTHKDDIGLLEHEKVHVRQFWQLGFLHPCVYRFWAKYRLDCEVEAYREQLKYSKEKEADSKLFASFIATKYDLKITEEEALGQLLSRPS